MNSRDSHSLAASRRSQSQICRCTSGSDSRRRSGRGGKSPPQASRAGSFLALSPLLPDQKTVGQHHGGQLVSGTIGVSSSFRGGQSVPGGTISVSSSFQGHLGHAALFLTASRARHGSTSRLGVDRTTCLDNAQPLPTWSRGPWFTPFASSCPLLSWPRRPVGVRRRDSRPGVLDVFGGQHQPLADRCGVAPERVRGSGSGCGRSPGGTGPAGRCRSGRTPPPASTPSLSLQAAIPHRSASVRPAAFMMPCCVPVGRVRLP